MYIPGGLLFASYIHILIQVLYFYLPDGMDKQNIYLLKRENFAPMQIFAMPKVVANY